MCLPVSYDKPDLFFKGRDTSGLILDSILPQRHSMLSSIIEEAHTHGQTTTSTTVLLVLVVVETAETTTLFLRLQKSKSLVLHFALYSDSLNAVIPHLAGTCMPGLLVILEDLQLNWSGAVTAGDSCRKSNACVVTANALYNWFL